MLSRTFWNFMDLAAYLLEFHTCCRIPFRNTQICNILRMQNLQKKISSKSPYSKCDDFMINNDQSQPQTHRGTLGAFSGGQACGISYISNAPAGPANIFPHTFWNFIAFVAYLLEIHTFGCAPSGISHILLCTF